MTLVGTFLAARAWEALHRAGFSFFTEQDWKPDAGRFGIAAVMVGSVLIALVAVVVAVPLAMGAALYIAEYAPRRLRPTLVLVIDLMAAVPSVVFGLWGEFFLQWQVGHPALDLQLVRLDPDLPGQRRRQPRPVGHVDRVHLVDVLAGLVVALMVTPIACSIMREAFSQAPAGEREGAYALGATRWGMIRSVVLPFGRGAIIGGTMLGLGRALGETIAVVMIISASFHIQPHILENGTSSVSSLIALHYGEASPFGISALMAAGLALFALTLLVNFASPRRGRPVPLRGGERRVTALDERPRVTGTPPASAAAAGAPAHRRAPGQ